MYCPIQTESLGSVFEPCLQWNSVDVIPNDVDHTPPPAAPADALAPAKQSAPPAPSPTTGLRDPAAYGIKR